jgi:2-hydroxychromene-2-carboxylate isomerase
VTSLRVALVDPAVTPYVYRAAWANNKNISDDVVLKEVLAAAGFDAQILLEKAGALEIKDKLRENTNRALKLGVFGVPTFCVNNDKIVWGQDRLSTVKKLLDDGLK